MALDHGIRVRRLTFETIFKLVAFGLLLSIVPLFLLMTLAGLLGIVPITVDGQLVTSFAGRISASVQILLGMLAIVFVGTIFLTVLLSIGLWILSRFQPFTVRYIAVETAYLPENK